MSELDRFAEKASELIAERLELREQQAISDIRKACADSSGLTGSVAIALCFKLSSIGDLRLSLQNAARSHLADVSRTAATLDGRQ